MKRRFSSTHTDPDVSASTQTLITVPFCRDPTQPVPELPPDVNKKPQPEPVVENPKPETEETEQIPEEETGVAPKVEKEVSSKRPAVYKKKHGQAPQTYYHPPEPWNGERDDSDILEDSAPKVMKSHSRKFNAIDGPGMQNPIRELQAMARPITDMNEDDPPFNFQAMLKRTPKNRASMKRLEELDNKTSEKQINVVTPKKAKAPKPPVDSTPKIIENDSLPLATIKTIPTPEKTTKTEIPVAKITDPPITKEDIGSQKEFTALSTQAKTTTNSVNTEAVPKQIEPEPTLPNKELKRDDSRDLIIEKLKRTDSKPELIYPVIDKTVKIEKIELAPGITVEGMVIHL